MKIRLNNNDIKRVASNGGCFECWFSKHSLCKRYLIDLCVTENIYYILHPYKSNNNSIFFI
jgi:hypothetical protein